MLRLRILYIKNNISVEKDISKYIIVSRDMSILAIISLYNSFLKRQLSFSFLYVAWKLQNISELSEIVARDYLNDIK